MRPQCRDLLHLAGRQHGVEGPVQPQLGGDMGHRRRRIAAHQPAGDAALAQGGDSFRTLGAQGISQRRNASHHAVDGHPDPGRTIGGLLILLRRLNTELAQQGAIADGDRVVRHLTDNAGTDPHLDRFRLGQCHSAADSLAHGQRQRVFARLLQGGSEAQLLVVATPARQHRLALSERAGFVEDQRLDGVGLLQGIHIFDQNAVARRDAGASDDGRRCGQPQRTGAGDHQHRHRRQQRLSEVVADGVPHQQGEQGDGHHHRHEHGGDLVNQLLQRGLAHLGALHQCDDLAEAGVLPHGSGFNFQHAGAVDGTAQHLVALAARHRQALAGEDRLVQLAGAAHDFAIHRHPFAHQHPQPITAQHLVDGDALPALATPDGGSFRPKRHQFANGGLGAASGPRFQQLAEGDQGNDDGARLEIELAAGSHPQRQQQIEAVEVGGAGAGRHQHIHVGCTVLDGEPGAAIETGPDPELHRGGEQQLQPGRQMPGEQPGHGQHPHQQRQRQQSRDDDPGLRLTGSGGLLRFPLQQLLAAAAGRTLCQLGAKAERFDLLAQSGRGLHPGDKHDAGLFDREVDLGRDNAGQRSQHLVQSSRTTGTSHAGNLKQKGLATVVITLTLDAVEHRRQAVRAGQLDGRLLQREVDGGRYPVEFVEAGRDAAGAVGAAHAAERQLQMNG